jgi:pyruvate kinase
MKLNKTKIVATLGPSSSSRSMLKKLLNAGVDAFRINFSHASYENTSQTIKLIRELSAELKIHASILADLQGPKIRLGTVKENTFLKKGGISALPLKKLPWVTKNLSQSIMLIFPKTLILEKKFLSMMASLFARC